VGWRDQGCRSKHDAEDGESGKYLLHGVLPSVSWRECTSLSATWCPGISRGSGDFTRGYVVSSFNLRCVTDEQERAGGLGPVARAI
jgi:hypothetical protein